MDLNDPTRKREAFLKGIGVKMVSDKESFEWYPVVYEGEWAIPEDWEVPTNFNPSPKATAKYKRAKGKKYLLEDLAEARYMHWKLKNGGFDTFVEHQRYRKLTRGLGIMATTRRPWPSTWYKNLIKLMEKGFTITEACRLIKVPQTTVALWYRSYPDFKATLDQASEKHKEKLIDVLDKITFTGESETNRLNAVKFYLERRYPNEFGQRNVVEVGEKESPMDVLLGSTAKDNLDEDEE